VKKPTKAKTASRLALESKWPHDLELWQSVAAESPEIFMAFSRGKDSIAAHLALRESGLFRKIHLVFFYGVPGLKFVEDSLTYFEEKFGEKIHRLPHPSLYRKLVHLVYQSPERCAVIEAANLPVFEYDDVYAALRKQFKLPENTIVCNGVRCCDSPVRRGNLSKFGPRAGVHSCKAIWNWNKSDVLEMIARHGIELPVDYKLFNRSFDGIDFRFLQPLRKHFPADYQKILDWFPLADLQLFREGQL
jgi:hypothetical protein